MGATASKFCIRCWQLDDEESIPFEPVLTKNPLSCTIDQNSSDIIKFCDPDQDRLTKIIEKALTDFYLHIECPFEEANFNEIFKKEKIRMSSKDCKVGYAMKSEYFLNVKAEDFLDLLEDISYRKSWDDSIDAIEIITSYPESTTVTYLKFKKFLLISARDAVLVNRTTKTPKGFVYVSASCELEDYPITDAAIRSNVETSGYYIEPQEDGRTKVVGYTKADAGGKIPLAVIKAAAAFALPRYVNAVEKAIKNKNSDNKNY